MSSHAPYAPDTSNPWPGASPALAEAARLIREAVRDKSYQLTPIGADAAGYLRAKRKRLTDSSYRDYESCLDKLARHFLDLQIEDFEPPAGSGRIEEFLDALWGDGAPRTYNKNLSIIKDFFRFQIMRGRLPKGQKVRELPLPHRAFWHDLEHHVLDIGAQPSHYLLCTQRTITRVRVRR